jgi:hypothetical protein
VGHELTITADAAQAQSPPLVRRVPAPVAPRGVADDRMARQPVPIASSLATARPVVDVSWSVPTAEPEEVIARLQTERAAARGGFSHPHVAVDCAFCRRAVAAYR